MVRLSMTYKDINFIYQVKKIHFISWTIFFIFVKNFKSGLKLQLL